VRVSNEASPRPAASICINLVRRSLAGRPPQRSRLIWYSMVWYGAPPTPRQCVRSLGVVASCSVHPVSERHRQAVQSVLVRR
jgi:hypothetical protein